jgi:hypothetical protein
MSQDSFSIPLLANDVNVENTTSSDFKIDSQPISEQNLRQSISSNTPSGNKSGYQHNTPMTVFQGSAPKSEYNNPVQNTDETNATKKCCNIT